ncbi:metal ABC transporter permease [Desulfoscipio geothermicus]|uniref:Zinc transport system permease protein n=1 Tax=Desulfoscipio geothermicus DSM 3669 TaxID=1121426 RepID=A0A1I6E6A5_9FIRM|nr:metal ABC transporter permease [Desulfoscipio geothermicus]SFR13265.1 zinc transport system permease protein [Desulfoscipio geothermicus DSM 3669]
MEIFHYDFMLRALGGGLLVGIICPVVGLFITLRRMSMIADALSHVCLSGVAAGLLLGTQPVLAAAAFALGGSLLIEGLREKYRHYAELSIAIILSAGVALAAILISLGNGLGGGFMSYLFGSLVLITVEDVWVMAAIGIPLLLLTLLFIKELFCITFDEVSARVSGLPVKLINTGFTVLTALTIAVAMRIVGILLVSSLMILPVAVAMQLARSFKGTLLVAVATGEMAVLAGLLLSFYLDLPPGGTIVMALVLALVMVLVVAPRRYTARAGA